MTVFALVHGAWHGGWCWERVIPELEARGHRAIAPDLPCDDPEAGVVEYADVVVEALAGEDGPVVAVGHSLGGLTIPLVAARRPVARLVFLAALVPDPNRPFVDVLRESRDAMPSDAGQERTATGGTVWRPEAAIPVFFDDCTPADAGAAAARLRPQHPRPIADPHPLEAWPDVPSTYIVCAADQAVAPDWQRRVAAPMAGVQPIELPGGHSPFIARPAELAALLVEVAA